jgi:CheY-like chemotaxis protein/anti-sigma regulatory factor (Ser/Thr protein kinase)
VLAIERAANAQARLVEDLLDVSRIVAGKLEMARVPVSLVEPLEAALEAIKIDAEQKRVHLKSEIDGKISLVLGDAQRLQQIVANLLTNAVKFTPSDGRVTVRVREVNRRVELSVADTGIGIAPEFLPHVFERFRQADGSAPATRSGLGIGLAIVQHLVALHGGEVAVASDGLGHGATFTIALPALDQPAGTLAVSERRSGPSPSRRLEAVRVLLVDDDPDTLAVITAMLESAGARVETATSAEEARSAVGAFRPTVLVSDLAMPQEDGCSFLRSLRELHWTVPAIALTARTRVADADEARAAGFQIYMQKPVQPEMLVNAVASLAASERPH